MTIDLWLAFAATATLIVLLPSPLACFLATLSLQRGRAAAVMTVPAFALGLAGAFVLVTVPVVCLIHYLPGVTDGLSWFALGYLMLYVLWCFQDPRTARPLADNDNLPERRPGRIFAHMSLRSVTARRYPLAFASMLVLFVNPDAPVVPQALAAVGIFLVCATVGGALRAIFPKRLLRRRRVPKARMTASGKPGTVFIARRAVTAGYRRIAA